MFADLSNAVLSERRRLDRQRKWLKSFGDFVRKFDQLDHPWSEKTLIHKIPRSIPSITRLSAVDGGVLSEACTGFDVILYRALSVTFHGVGKKVQAKYYPTIDPEPKIFLAPSLGSRFEFSKMSNLLRLLVEYQVARDTVKKESPTIMYIDGKVTPITSDFSDLSSQTPGLKQTELEVKQTYRELVQESMDRNVLLTGIVKDSRSREHCKLLSDSIPVWVRENVVTPEQVKGWSKVLPDMLDQYLANQLLQEGERLAWVRSRTPSWLAPKQHTEVWSTLVKPLKHDMPIRVEVIVNENNEENLQALDIALGALSYLSQHGLPVAIPTIILEADSRVKLNYELMDAVLDQIAMSLGMPKDQLLKKREFTL